MTITKQSINRMKTCLPVCNILFDPFHHRWLCIQVIHGDVKEALEKCHQHGHWSSCTWSANKSPKSPPPQSAAPQSNTTTINTNNNTWIWLAWRSIVMMWSAPATESMLATFDRCQYLVLCAYFVSINNCYWKHRKILALPSIITTYQLCTDWGSALVLLVLPEVKILEILGKDIRLEVGVTIFVLFGKDIDIVGRSQDVFKKVLNVWKIVLPKIRKLPLKWKLVVSSQTML